MLSYSGGFAETVAELADYEAAGLDIVWVPEAYSFDAVSQLGYIAARTSRLRDRLRRHAALHAHPDADRDDRGRARLRLRRPVHPRPRRVRPAGDRGVPRRRATTRRSRGPARWSRSAAQVWRREAVVHRGQALPDPAAAWAGHRAGQAAQADQPPGARADPDRAGRDRPAQRRARRGDRRGLAALFLYSGAGGPVWGAALARGPGPPRPRSGPAGRRGHRAARASPTTPRRPPRAGRRTGRCSRCTSGGMGARAATSPTTGPRRYGYERAGAS